MSNKKDNSIKIGNNNIIKNSTIGNGNSENGEKGISKFLWFVIVPIVTAVIAGIVLFLLKMN